jgi:hypothetical protein
MAALMLKTPPRKGISNFLMDQSAKTGVPPCIGKEKGTLAKEGVNGSVLLSTFATHYTCTAKSIFRYF